MWEAWNRAEFRLLAVAGFGGQGAASTVEARTIGLRWLRVGGLLGSGRLSP